MTNAANKTVSNRRPRHLRSALEALEDRRLLAAAPWNPWTIRLGIDQVYEQFPWLNGDGHGVAVIDRGINYYHPNLGGDRDTGTKAPRIVNVRDYEQDDDDPYPETDPAKDDDRLAGHGTGVAGLLIAPEYEWADKAGTFRQKGMLPGATLYNLKEDTGNASQSSIREAMEWIVANHEQFHITAVNLTDFIGTPAQTPAYDAAAKALWDAGVFVSTPIANSWLGEPEKDIPPHQPIGFPAKSPWVFGIGGASNATTMYPKSQRGPHLDLLGPAKGVTTLYYRPSDPDTITNFAEGNSWSVPITTSTAVMIQQIDPTVTPAEIMAILQDSGVTITDPDAFSNPDGTITYQRLDVLEAIKLAYVRRDDALDRSGGNDTLAKARAIKLPGGKGSASSLKLLMHDHDYFKFTAVSDGKFDVKINYGGPSAFPGGQLLDGNGGVVANIGAGGLNDRALSAGTYYVHLFNPSAALRGTYSVAVEQASVSTPPAGAVGRDGSFNGVQYDKDDRLHFAWFDETSRTLKYASRSATNVWSSITTIDATPGAGQFLSLKLDKNGRPGVAYYASATADLKYAHFDGSSWDVETVSSKNVTGSYPSLAYNGANRPVISYFHSTSGDLRLASKGTSGWKVTAIDTAGDVGRYSSLALNTATGRWAVAYEATGVGGFKYASQNKNGSWATTLVDKPGLAGGYVSLAFDRNKNPAFSYFAAKTSDLRLARFAGGKWSVKTVASKGNVGLYTNLLFDPAARFNPVIYYYNKGGDKLTVARGNASNVFSLTAIKIAGGRHNRVALDSDGDETFVWLDSGSGDLKVADA